MASVHHGKFTWNPKMEVWKMIFLFNGVIFRFHVNFPGCNFLMKSERDHFLRSSPSKKKMKKHLAGLHLVLST